MRIDFWDARTGGSHRYSAWRDGEKISAFYGSFHELRQNQRLAQTFTYEDIADGVSLETITLADLGDGGPESCPWRSSTVWRHAT